MNADGVRDFVVGSPFAVHPVTNSKSGGVFFYSGADGVPFTNSPNGGVFTLAPGGEFGTSVAGGDDLNGDGYSEVLIGAPGNNSAIVISGIGGATYYNLATPTVGNWYVGQPSPAAITPIQFGFSSGDAGDVNGDGVRDFIVGGPSATVYNPFFPPSTNGGAGMAVIYDGATGANMMELASSFNDFNGLYGTYTDQNFGWAVGGIGDWDGDGFDDVYVTSPAGLLRKGKVSIYSGLWISTVDNLNPPAVPPVIVEFFGTKNDEYLGFSAANAGDINGDGVDDLIVGSLLGAQVFMGGSTPTNKVTLFNFADLAIGAFKIVAGGMDLNGDGVPDMLVGPDDPNGTGSASIRNKARAYSGATGTSLFVAKAAPQAGGVSSMALLPDSSGNGKAEILLGMPDGLVGGMPLGNVVLLFH